MSIKLKPCKSCGSKDIELWECGYSSFNPGGGKCRNCKFESKGEAGCMPKEKDLARIWNAGQKPTETEKLRTQLAEMTRERDELKESNERMKAVLKDPDSHIFKLQLLAETKVDEIEVLEAQNESLQKQIAAMGGAIIKTLKDMAQFEPDNEPGNDSDISNWLEWLQSTLSPDCSKEWVRKSELTAFSVRLVSPTESEPFRKLDCVITDIGYADRIITVECTQKESE